MEKTNQEMITSLLYRTWMSIKQAGEYLGLSKATMYRLLQRGELAPNGIIAGKKRFTRTYLDRVVRVNAESIMNDNGRDHHAEEESETSEDTVSMRLPARKRSLPGQSAIGGSTHGQATTTRESGPRNTGRSGSSTNENHPENDHRHSQTSLKAEIARLREGLD